MYSYIHVYRKERKKVKLLSRVLLFATPWTIAYQAAPSMGFSRQEYWSGLPFASPGDFPDPGIEPRSPTLQSDALLSEPSGKFHIYVYMCVCIHIVLHSKLVGTQYELYFLLVFVRSSQFARHKIHSQLLFIIYSMKQRFHVSYLTNDQAQRFAGKVLESLICIKLFSIYIEYTSIMFILYL